MNDEAKSTMDTAFRFPNRTLAALSIDTEHLAREAVAHHCYFRGRVDGFHFEQHGDVLTVTGRVPSFYLRHVLRKVLTRVDGVREVDDQVDVVACDGLSSVRT